MEKKMMNRSFPILLLYTGFLIYRFGTSMTSIKGIILSCILLYASYSDLKSREVADYLHIMIFITSFIDISVSRIPEMLLSGILIIIFFVMVIFFTNTNNMGGADYKIMTALTVAMGLGKSVAGMIMGLSLSILFNLKNKSGFPLVPYLSAGYMVAYLL